MYTRESLFTDSSLPFCIHDARGYLNSGYLHSHNCLEINYVLGGNGINYIDGRHYDMTCGDVFLINNYEHHFAGAQENLQMKVLYFDAGFVWDHSPENYCLVQSFYSKHRRDGNRIRLSAEEDLHFRRILAQLEKEYRERLPGFSLFLKSGLTELLAILYRATVSSQPPGTITDYLAYEKLLPAIQYIQDHPCEDLTLSRLAALSCMSRTYFSSFFRNAMSMNVSVYIEQVRIRNAQRMLLTTSLSVTEICFACGYHSLSSFHTAFHKLCGTSPGQFRKRHVHSE